MNKTTEEAKVTRNPDCAYTGSLQPGVFHSFIHPPWQFSGANEAEDNAQRKNQPATSSIANEATTRNADIIFVLAIAASRF